MRYVVDAHAIIWFLAGSPNLGPNAKFVLNHNLSDIVFPATALAEVYWIIEHKPARVGGLTADLVKKAIDKDPRITIYPLDRTVIERSISLTKINEMHDRLITATAAVIIDSGDDASLITFDNNITAADYVPIVW